MGSKYLHLIEPREAVTACGEPKFGLDTTTKFSQVTCPACLTEYLGG